jgi:hypothetical protein
MIRVCVRDPCPEKPGKIFLRITGINNCRGAIHRAPTDTDHRHRHVLYPFRGGNSMYYNMTIILFLMLTYPSNNNYVKFQKPLN